MKTYKRIIGIDGSLSTFTSFSTLFQLYQEDGRMIMKGSVELGAVYV